MNAESNFWQRYEGAVSAIEDRPPDMAMAATRRQAEMLESLSRHALALEKESRLDSLTQLPNERAFNEQRYIAAARSERSGEACSIASLDLAGLTEINDVSHALGDDALRLFARAAEEAAVRATDQIFRISGDQFAGIFEGDAEPASFCQRLQEILERKRYRVAGQSLRGYCVAAIYEPQARLRPSEETIAAKMDNVYAESQRLLSLQKKEVKGLT